MALNLDLDTTKDDLYGILRDTSDEETLRWLMKSDKNLLKAELYVAERMARIGGKRKTYNTHKVEVNLADNIDMLTEELYSGTYKPSRGTAHIIEKPVKREIFAAQYIDRIVHHYVVDTIYPWWDRRLWYGSSSCRVGKGTQYGVNLLDKHIRQVSNNYAEPVFVVKFDFSGYFMHINRKKLLERVLWGLDRQFAGNYNKRYRVVKNAIKAIIMDDPVDGVKIKGSYENWRDLPPDKSLFAAPEGCGIVIGNVTSQVFSNIFLDKLDRFIVYVLGYKYYGRYVDDFYIVVTESGLKKLKRDVPVIRNFALGMGLTLNDKKTRVIPDWQGVPFLGIVNRKGAKMPDKRFSRNYRMAVKDYIAGVDNMNSLVSYIGMMKHYDAYKMLKKAFDGNEALFDEILFKVDYFGA